MGKSPSVPEGSAESGASRGEEGWGPGSESGARRGSRGPWWAGLWLHQTGAPAAGGGEVGPGGGGWGTERAVPCGEPGVYPGSWVRAHEVVERGSGQAEQTRLEQR